MQKTSRSRWMSLVLPAVVALIIYELAFVIPNSRVVSKLEKDLEAAKAKEPTPNQALAQRTRLAVLQKEIAKIQNEETLWLQNWESLAGPCLAAPARADRLTQLLTLLNKQGVHVVDHGPFETAREMKLTGSHEKLLKLFAERNGKSAPQPWRLQFAGKYGDVTQAIRSLSSGAPLAIPLGLMMKEALHPTSMHEWVMIVWI